MSKPEQQYTRCFSTPAGMAVLSHLRDMTINRVMSPNMSDNHLRWVAAQCALVRHIESMILRGRGDLQ